MSFTEVMKNSENMGTKEAGHVFARTAEILQNLGPDYRKNTGAVVSGALSVVGGLFSVYVETGDTAPRVRSGSKLPPGLAADLEMSGTWMTNLPGDEKRIIQFGVTGRVMPHDPLIEKYGIKGLIGAVVMADLRPAGILWVADRCSREFTSDHIHALQCLAGVLGCRAELRRAQKDRENAKMAEKVAHDLNNILSALVSYPELILMQMEGSNPLRESISFIHESGLLASDMVQDFLFLARSRPYTPSPIDPVPVAKAYFSGSTHEQLKLSCPHVRFSFQARTTLCRVRISELFLTKIINTLLGHSAHGAAPGTRIDLSLTNHLPDENSPAQFNGLHLRVTDDRPPVSREDLGRLFVPFYTQKKMGRPGSGLGLAVIKKMVKDHGGKITVGSQKKRGNFTDIFLPAPALTAGGLDG